MPWDQLLFSLALFLQLKLNYLIFLTSHGGCTHTKKLNVMLFVGALCILHDREMLKLAMPKLPK